MAKFIQYSTKESLYDGPFDSKVGWAAAGMGDLIVTGEGRLIAVDGGCNNDDVGFVELLEKYADGKKPVVDLWIITHPHGDHYGAINTISKNPELASRIEVKKFMYWFPMEFTNAEGVAGVLGYGNKDMEAVAAVFGAEIEQPYRDQKINIDDVELHFLYVPDDCSVLNTAGGNPNHCSLIFSVKGPAKKAMITGDAYGRSMQITAWRYRYDLGSDIMQFPHHALPDSFHKDFYKYVDAKTVFLPISIAGYRATHSNMYSNLEGGMANLATEAKADYVYKAFEGTFEVEI